MFNSFSRRMLLGVALFGALALTPEIAMAETELPDYKVVKTLTDEIEIRDYPALLLAETTVEGEREAAVNEGFRILADYIFGNNQTSDKIEMTAPVTQATSEKIAMTAPVTQSVERAGRWVVAFMMPSEYTAASLPVPNNERVRIVETAPKRVAAIRFSGRYTNGNFDKHRARRLQRST